MEERICRVCLASEKTDEFSRIFENNLALKIFLVSSVKIIEMSTMPALICKACEIEIYQCINFRRKIQSSQEYFNKKPSIFESLIENYLEQVGDENILEDSENLQEIIEERIDLNETIEEYLDEDDDLINLEEELPIKDQLSISETPAGRLSCKYCGLKLSRRQRLIQHERLHFLKTTNKYTCDKCGKQFNQHFGLIPHFQKNHNFKLSKIKERWKCAICDDKILAPGNMEVHYQKVHKEFYAENTGSKDDTSYYSDKIKTKKNTKKKKKLNVKMKSDIRRAKIFFPCEICGNSFTSSQRYHKHLNNQHGVIQTDTLQENVTNENMEMSSLVPKTSHKQKSIPCSTCGKMFSNLNTCKTHEKIHSGLKFICDICGSTFSMKPYLTSHVQKVHLKLRRFKCSMCTESFVHRELLNYHIKKHLNIRNYACQFCQKTFVRKACALIHERIHKNERPYSCKYCDRQFIHHSDHRRHELRHINDFATEIGT